MKPTLKAGQIVIASGWFLRAREGEVVIVRHGGLEKIKRIEEHRADGTLYLLGDNLMASTDSRSFGVLHNSAIVGKVLWPFIN